MAFRQGMSWYRFLLLGSCGYPLYHAATRRRQVYMQKQDDPNGSDYSTLAEQTPEYKDFIARLEVKLQAYGKSNHLGEGRYQIMELTSDGYKKLTLESLVLFGGLIIVPYKMHQGYKTSTLKRSALVCVPLTLGLAFLYKVGSITVRKVSVWPKQNSIQVEMGYAFAPKYYTFKIGDIDRDEPDQETEKELQRKLTRNPDQAKVSPDAAFAAQRVKRKGSEQGECEYFIGNAIGQREPVSMYIKRDPQFTDFKHDQEFFYKLFDPEFE